MTVQEALAGPARFTPPTLPDRRYIEAAVQRVHKKWPDVVVPLGPADREALAARLREHVATNDWRGARISFVLAAATAVFDAERRDRADLAETRSFLCEEVGASRSEGFLSGMMAVHLECFVEGAPHSRALASALAGAFHRLPPAGQRLVTEIPEVLDAARGPHRLAARMSQMADPFAQLVRAGLRTPHGAGFMAQAHDVMSTIVEPELTTRARIDWYLTWLRPPGREARTIGAERAIEALTRPWLNTAPSEALRSHLVENLIEMYGDPRIRSGGVWAGVAPESMKIVHRWLTREDMRFFTGVVDLAQSDPMWPPRRDFWLQLYDEGRIDAAWVAFSARAARVARENLMRHEARNADSRFGFQGRIPDTSLLIMKIGDKILVEGCHSYSTRIFSNDDPGAPKLYLEEYDAIKIRNMAPVSLPHNSIGKWERKVIDMLNADLGCSHKYYGS